MLNTKFTFTVGKLALSATMLILRVGSTKENMMIHQRKDNLRRFVLQGDKQ